MTGDEGVFGAGALENEQPEGVPKGPGGDQSGKRRKAKKKGEMLRKVGTVKPSSRELLGPGVQGRSGAELRLKKKSQVVQEYICFCKSIFLGFPFFVPGTTCSTRRGIARPRSSIPEGPLGWL